MFVQRKLGSRLAECSLTIGALFTTALAACTFEAPGQSLKLEDVLEEADEKATAIDPSANIDGVETSPNELNPVGNTQEEVIPTGNTGDGQSPSPTPENNHNNRGSDDDQQRYGDDRGERHEQDYESALELFEREIDPILAMRCGTSACHSNSQSPTPMRFVYSKARDTYSAVTSSGLIVRFDPMASPLLIEVDLGHFDARYIETERILILRWLELERRERGP